MQGFGNMMNFTTIYGIYGEEKGINIYKYFDFHSVVSAFIAQFLISFFGASYSVAMIFFAVINLGGLFIVQKISFPESDDEEIEN